MLMLMSAVETGQMSAAETNRFLSRSHLSCLKSRHRLFPLCCVNFLDIVPSPPTGSPSQDPGTSGSRGGRVFVLQVCTG